MAPPPSSWTSRALGTLLALSVAAGDGVRAQRTTGTVRDARVEITTDSAVVVHERVTLAGAASVSFEWRSDPCSAMDPPRVTVDGTAVSMDLSSSGPWRFLHVPVATGSDSTVTVDVDYRVHPTGATWSVPLVVPASPLHARAGLERDAVVVTVTAPGARAVFPAFTSRAAGQFEARLSAVPSLVRLQPAVGSPCAPGQATGDNGLTIRFTLLVLTMLLWVPLYFWWAGRREHDT